MANNVFESKSIPKAYFTLAVPVVLGMVISIVYNITDTYYISLTKNTDLVAGVSLCAPVFTLLMGFGNIFGQGGSSLISRLLGKKDSDNLRRVSSFCFYAAILVGLVSGVLMLLFRIPILHLLGADSETVKYALPYFTIFAAGAPVVTLSFIHTNLLRSEGMAKESMKAREVKRAKLVAKYAEKRAALKEIVNKSNDPVEAYEAARKLQSIPKNANPIRLHNRCKLTGRPKGYIRQFGISRIQFREMASAGLIPGVKKASW